LTGRVSISPSYFELAKLEEESMNTRLDESRHVCSHSPDEVKSAWTWHLMPEKITQSRAIVEGP
jgi:hypothetical protein